MIWPMRSLPVNLNKSVNQARINRESQTIANLSIRDFNRGDCTFTFQLIRPIADHTATVALVPLFHSRLATLLATIASLTHTLPSSLNEESMHCVPVDKSVAVDERCAGCACLFVAVITTRHHSSQQEWCG